MLDIREQGDPGLLHASLEDIMPSFGPPAIICHLLRQSCLITAGRSIYISFSGLQPKILKEKLLFFLLFSFSYKAYFSVCISFICHTLAAY